MCLLFAAMSFFFQAEDGIRDGHVTGVQTCALPILSYAGLKSMVFAGLGADDKRVKAATEWIKKNYDLKSNPGMGNAGLYYYYLTYVKALDAIGEPQFTDAKGVKHDWRKEL